MDVTTKILFEEKYVPSENSGAKVQILEATANQKTIYLAITEVSGDITFKTINNDMLINGVNFFTEKYPGKELVMVIVLKSSVSDKTDLDLASDQVKKSKFTRESLARAKKMKHKYLIVDTNHNNVIAFVQTLFKFFLGKKFKQVDSFDEIWQDLLT